ncbi:leucine-rich repeat domain-containing protein [Qingrenia yutianensis]|uniref:Leucine-rich repeat protein n=1 Tax=Qingrenia yutianensis TaxID=2763676 RepID=A0A926F862_9FIRM|nr:leucine-rich repeat domain-containing protein [Qingrenia yutianensis]MBC8596018.1 leucine-rich repeat protein [Qingrenia yutianensis]
MMKKFLCIVLALSMVMCLAPNVFAEDVIAEGKCGDSVTWKIVGNTLTFSGSGAMDEFIDMAWYSYRNDIYNVVIEEGITYLTHELLCDLKWFSSVKIPDSVTSVGTLIFSNCTGLETVEIGKGLKSITPSAFSNCPNLEEIAVSPENENLASVGGVLFNKDITNLIYFPNGWFDKENIGENEGNYTIPDTVTKITDGALNGKLYLKNFYTNENSAYTAENGVLFNKDKTELVRYPSGNERSTYIIPESVQNIYESAFSYAKNLTDVTLPQNISKLADNTFSDCTNLKGIEIPKNVTEIGSYAFSDCSNLEKAVLHDGIVTLGSGVFYECGALKYADIPKNLTEIPRSTFYGCESLKNIKLPGSVKTVDFSAFQRCTSLTEIDIPQSVTLINSSAFEDCESLKTVTFRNSGVIKAYVFSGCPNLTRVNIFSDSIIIWGDTFYDEAEKTKDIYFAVSADNVVTGREDGKVCVEDLSEDGGLKNVRLHCNTPCTVSSVTENEEKATVSVNAKNIDAQSKVTVGFYKNGALADIKVCDVSDLTAETDKDFDTVKIMTFPSLPSLEPLCIKEEL